MAKQRGRTPAEDIAQGWVEEGVITHVDPYATGPGWSVSWGDGMGCGVRDVGITPKVGDTLTTFGQFGHTFHGQALNGEVLWYLTVEDEEAERQANITKADQDKRDRFEADRARLDATYESLPDTFKERIDKFRRTNPDWRWQWESYEMFACTEALKIASYCSITRLADTDDGHEPTADENLAAYRELPYDDQKKAGIDDGHSGNTFGFACRLAHWWVTDPGMVVIEHGALTTLVGCEDYGCPHEVMADA